MAVYFYKGDTLSKYCKDKGYKYSKIVSRIREKFMTVEEAIKGYEEYDAQGKKCPSVIMWILSDGRGLRQACIEEDVCYETAIRKIHECKSVDEAFSESKKNRWNKITNLKYVYKGQPLLHYFKGEEKKYQYAIGLIRKKHMSVEDAVERAKEKKYIQRYKYFYEGVLLSRYCKEKGYPFCSIIRRIKKNNMSVEDALLDYLKSKKKRESLKYQKRSSFFSNESFEDYLNKIKGDKQ